MNHKKFWTVCSCTCGFIIGFIISRDFSTAGSFAFALISALLFYPIGRISAIMMSPGKKDVTKMNDKEKETYQFEQEKLKGFSGGFFGMMAISITNLLACFTREQGYQNHPTLFRLVYGVITIGIGFIRDGVVNDVLNKATDNINKSTLPHDND